MRSDSLFAAFGAAPSFAFFLLFLLLGACVYLALILQINARTSPIGGPAAAGAKSFGLAEAMLAAALTPFLLLNVSASVSRSPVKLNSHDLLANLVFTIVIVLFIAMFLRLRGFDLSSLAGLFRLGFLRAVSMGTILLLAAYPLIALSEAITPRFFC